MEHQRHQAESLRLVGQEPRDQSPEPDRFVHQSSSARVRARDVLPSASVGGVDGFQDRFDSRGQVVWLRDLEADPSIANLGLHANEPLAHRRRRDEEGRSDPGCVETEDGL